jgi:hypothetical protein
MGKNEVFKGEHNLMLVDIHSKMENNIFNAMLRQTSH